MLLSCLAIYLSFRKKDYHCISVCIIALAYDAVDWIHRIPSLAGSMLFEVFSWIKILLMISMLVVTVWVYRKPLTNGKHFILPIILCIGTVVCRVIRKIYYYVQMRRILEPGSDVIMSMEQLEFGYTLLDMIHAGLFCCFMVSVIFSLHRIKTKRIS